MLPTSKTPATPADASWWNAWFGGGLDYYTRYFNVTTGQVEDRLRGALFLDRRFLEDLHGQPDVWGPLWLSVSLAMSCFVVSSISKVPGGGGAALTAGPPFEALSAGLVEVVGYTAFSSLAASAFLQWRGVDSLPFLEVQCLMGYSLVPLFPALLVCLVPFGPTQGLAFLAGSVGSAIFISRNLWPALKASPRISREQAFLFLVGLLGVHVIFGILLHYSFFKSM